MSSLRDELESRFASADLQSKDNNTTNETGEREIEEEEQSFKGFSDAPKSYTKEFQENFKTLSPEWQKYLIEREKQTEKGFSELGNKLNAYKWTEQIFKQREKRLIDAGLKKPQEYLEKLAAVDDQLAMNPKETLMMLAQTYGVDLNNINTNNNALKPDMQKQLFDLIKYQNEVIGRQNVKAAKLEYDNFVGAGDENGNSKHPFFEEVRHDMAELMKKGAADSLEEAYDKAVWLNEDVREKLISQAISDKLDEKIKEANDAKSAAFSPVSKAMPAEKELTLREELEALFRKEF